VAGPLFYLAHEAFWNYAGPDGDQPIQVRLTASGEPIAVNRALAKTVAFRTIASSVDFAANYLVVRDVATAVALSATGFVLDPFVYYGHEKAWDYYAPGPVKPLRA